jgi:hydroxyacylglutathione hydrolase
LGYNAFPDAITIGSCEFVDNKDRERILEQIKAFDDEYYLVRDYEIEYPEINYIVREDGQQLEVGETVMTFYKAPGHTEDGIFAILEPAGIFIAGDYLSDIEFPYIYHDSRHYENTLIKVDEILKKQVTSLLVPGHGKVTKDLHEIKRRQQESISYVRTLREAIRNNDHKTIEDLIADCPFPRFMRRAHEENQKLMKKELDEILP